MIENCLAVDAKILNNSVLLIDKPPGLTSFHAVAAVRRMAGVDKVGHSGTLDKFASGLLVICTGFATKFTRFFLENDKRYHGVIKLGVSTDTCDMEGNVTEILPIDGITLEGINQALSKFTGRFMQIPPDYSSLKINGKRASDLVRRGKSVDLKAREIEIYSILFESYNSETGDLTISVHCSKGTYIRALARDIGSILKCGAHLAALRRISSGIFSIENAASLEDVKDRIEGRETEKDFMVNPEDALKGFSSITVNDSVIFRIINGAYFRKEDVIEINSLNGNLSIIMDKSRNILALAEINFIQWNVKYLNIFNKNC